MLFWRLKTQDSQEKPVSCHRFQIFPKTIRLLQFCPFLKTDMLSKRHPQNRMPFKSNAGNIMKPSFFYFLHVVCVCEPKLHARPMFSLQYRFLCERMMSFTDHCTNFTIGLVVVSLPMVYMSPNVELFESKSANICII
jgi:hypothetical protein